MINLKNFSLFESDSESYSFEDLSPDSKKKAIEKIRDGMYKGEFGAYDIPDWVIDDDYLFEPTHQELTDTFGPNYIEDLKDSPMIGNSREGITYETGIYLNCSKALDINNTEMFLGWLGISPFYWEDVYFEFRDTGSFTSIEFEIENYDELEPERIKRIEFYLERAEKKFQDHMKRILKRIESSIDAQYEDSEIIERIASNNYKFDKEGNPLQ